MSGELLGQLDDDARGIFITDFAEAVLYSPKDGRLPPRSILAIVDRDMQQNPGTVQRGGTDRLRIVVINSATDGISSAELNMGGDVITVARRIGEIASDLRIVAKTIEDRGVLELELA